MGLLQFASHVASRETQSICLATGFVEFANQLSKYLKTRSLRRCCHEAINLASQSLRLCNSAREKSLETSDEVFRFFHSAKVLVRKFLVVNS